MSAVFILASGSATRAAMLRAAGLDFDVRPAEVDERAIETARIAAGESPSEVALALAAAKAENVAKTEPKLPVIGADQIMEIEGAIGHKPSSLDEASRQLARLAGAAHFLHTAAVVLTPDGRSWRQVVTARLAMRPLSPEEIANYLDKVGADALTSVGGYKIEGPGIQLFDDIHGDYFAILGLPLLPLLKALRDLDIPG